MRSDRTDVSRLSSKDIRLLMRALDETGDGCLDGRELTHAIAMLGLGGGRRKGTGNAALAAELLEEYDLDGDGKIDAKEFELMLRAVSGGKSWDGEAGGDGRRREDWDL